MPTQPTILSHPARPSRQYGCSAAANLTNLLENIVRISGEKIAAHYRTLFELMCENYNNREQSMADYWKWLFPEFIIDCVLKGAKLDRDVPT